MWAKPNEVFISLRGCLYPGSGIAVMSEEQMKDVGGCKPALVVSLGAEHRLRPDPWPLVITRCKPSSSRIHSICWGIWGILWWDEQSFSAPGFMKNVKKEREGIEDAGFAAGLSSSFSKAEMGRKSICPGLYWGTFLRGTKAVCFR